MDNLPVDGERIERILRTELERATELYHRERAHFRNITKDVPSQTPHPDGVLRIRQAAEHQNNAVDAYMVALKRFNDYVIRRIVPDDLKPVK